MPATPYQRRRRSYRPHLELLEKREVPAVLTVTNLLDNGAGSLRAEVALAQDGDTIQFADGLSGQITLTTGTIAMNHSIDIEGPGADVITISGNHAVQVFDIPATSTVMISGLTITDGKAPNLFIGGGGIFNVGTLTIANSTLGGNSAGNPRNLGGGAICNQGRLAIMDSTFSGNSANEGGAILNIDSGTLTVLDSTFNGNVALLSYPGSGFGGAIAAEGNSVTLTGCTLSGNSALIGGGIGGFSSDVVNLRNTIIAKNRVGGGPDVFARVNSQGHNLIGDGSTATGFDSTDLVGTADDPIDPLLGPLQDNGGPTPTMALLVGSPAIAAGDTADAPPTDQRGAPRIVNGTIDIGAYEVQPAPAPSCSVAQSMLWPPNHQLINVGLSVQLNEDADPTTQVSVQVYANDNANASDAADIGPDTLQLRSERQGNGRGRVYLIVATATDASGQTGFDVCTVVVPHDQSARSLAEVQTEAATAAAYYQDFQTAPAGYALLGEGPAVANGHGWPSLMASLGEGFRLAPVARVNPPTTPSQWPTFRAIPTADSTGEMLADGTVVSVDGYFAASHEEPFQFRRLRSEVPGGNNGEMVTRDTSLDFMTADSWSE